MPLIEVTLYENHISDESASKMIEKLTDAMHDATGAAKDHIHVIVHGVSAKHWGVNGKPSA